MFYKEHFKTFLEAFVDEFYLKLKLILRTISYLTYICWEIDNFVIKSDIFRRFFICKNILKKFSCYHDNYFRYFMFGKYNGFCQQGEGFCMHVFSSCTISATRLYLKSPLSSLVLPLDSLATGKQITKLPFASQRIYYQSIFTVCVIKSLENDINNVHFEHLRRTRMLKELN